MNTMCYGILCKNQRTGRTYPRYLVTIADNPLSLATIKDRAYPNAERLFIADSRRKATALMQPYLRGGDPPQPELFEHYNTLTDAGATT